MPISDEKMRIRLAIPPLDHDQLRILAAKAKLSMSQYCEAIILEAIQAEKTPDTALLASKQPPVEKKKPGRPKKDAK